MESLPIPNKRKARLKEHAQWNRQDFQDAVKGISQGYEDVKAGRTRPTSEFLNDMRHKHSLLG